MTSSRTLRASAFGFALLFGVVVGLGYMPGHTMQMGNERQLFGTYMMSTVDDVTHGLSALLCALALISGPKMVRAVFIALGSYYALDAAFYLIAGVIDGKALGANLGLNMPHVLISSTMLWLALRGVGPRSNASETPRAA
jgi:hypothetical protein